MPDNAAHKAAIRTLQRALSVPYAEARTRYECGQDVEFHFTIAHHNESLPDAIVTVDSAGAVLQGHPAGMQLVGFANEAYLPPQTCTVQLLKALGHPGPTGGDSDFYTMCSLTWVNQALHLMLVVGLHPDETLLRFLQATQTREGFRTRVDAASATEDPLIAEHCRWLLRKYGPEETYMDQELGRLQHLLMTCSDQQTRDLDVLLRPYDQLGHRTLDKTWDEARATLSSLRGRLTDDSA